MAPFYGDLYDFQAHYPVTQVEQEPNVARNLIIEVDVGEGDVWLGSTDAFQEELSSLGINHVWNVWPGEHDGYYWGGHLGDYLRFYGSAFNARSG